MASKLFMEQAMRLIMDNASALAKEEESVEDLLDLCHNKYIEAEGSVHDGDSDNARHSMVFLGAYTVRVLAELMERDR